MGPWPGPSVPSVLLTLGKRPSPGRWLQGWAATPPQYHLVFKVRLQLMDILEPPAQGTPPVAAKTETALVQTPPFCHLKGAIAATHAPKVAFLVMARSFWALSNPVRDARARSDARFHQTRPRRGAVSVWYPAILANTPLPLRILLESPSWIHMLVSTPTPLSLCISPMRLKSSMQKLGRQKAFPLLLGREHVSVWLQSDRDLSSSSVGRIGRGHQSTMCLGFGSHSWNHGSTRLAAIATKVRVVISDCSGHPMSQSWPTGARRASHKRTKR